MRTGRIAATLMITGFLASAAWADDRDFCADRPGKATPTCTLDPGKFQVEVGLLDYAHSKDADQVENDTTAGDILLRYGVTDSLEARAEWSGYGWQHSRDRATGMVEHDHGGGDLTLSVRQNLRHPDDTGTALALLPFVTLPVGHQPIGDGTWSAGLIVPFGADLAKDWRLTLDPEVDAAADDDGSGRHLAYAMAGAITRSIGKAWQLTTEGWVRREQDPSGHETLASVDFSAAYQLPDGNRQVDLLAYVGATHATPRIELVLGVAERF